LDISILAYLSRKFNTFFSRVFFRAVPEKALAFPSILLGYDKTAVRRNGAGKRVLAVQRFFEEGCPEFPAFRHGQRLQSFWLARYAFFRWRL
jgi:hypothetical protein